MDPISQAALGAMGANTLSLKKKNTRLRYAFYGALGGLAPDLDYFISSATDPLLTIDFHRQFSHSLIFIPFGALIVSLFLSLFKVPIKKSYLPVFLGYATHGLLDACTSYGTQLLWPFSRERFSWSIVSVVDPLLTIILLLFIFLWIRKKRVVFYYLSWGWIISYLLINIYSQNRIKNYLINSHLLNSGDRYIIKPTIMNNRLWRIVIDDNVNIKSHAISGLPFSKMAFYKGESKKKLTQIEILNLKNRGEIYKDVLRFQFFTDGFLHWGEDGTIVDSRYSLVPHRLDPLWSIDISGNPNEHVILNVFRKPSKTDREILFKMYRSNKL